MNSKLRWTLLPLLLVALLALGVACGGSGDDSDDPSNGSDEKNGGKASSPLGGGAKKSKNGTLPEIKDNSFDKGSIRIDVTGDKRFTVAIDGTGEASGGILLLIYGSAEAASYLTFVSEASDEEGGFALTTKEMATAGAWGKDCDVTIDVKVDRVSGEFECKDIDAVDSKVAKVYKVTLKGKFSAGR